MTIQRYLFPALLVAACPLLMGPAGTGCPTCPLNYLQTVKHELEVDTNVTYDVVLTVHSGNIDLAVTGDLVGDDECSTEGDTKTCTFVARGDGYVDVFVSGAPGPGTYSLDYYWD